MMSFSTFARRSLAVGSLSMVIAAGLPAVASAAPAPINGSPSVGSSIFKSAPPSAPRSLNAKAGDSRVALSWSKPSNSGDSAISGYKVYYSSTSSTGPWTLSGTVTTRSRTITGLTNGTGYWFRVTAVNMGGEGNAAVSSRTVPAVPPSAPTNIDLTPGSDQVSLTWDAPENNGGSPVTSYTVSRATSSSGPWVTVSRITGRSVTARGLLGGTSYWFRVTATNPVGVGAAGTASTETLPAVEPGNPTNLTVVRGDSQVRVNWLPPTVNGGAPITGYKVSYAEASDGPWTEFDTVAGRTLAVTGLSNGTPYWFQVAAINSAGESTGATTVTSTTPGSAPTAPENLQFEASSTTMGLSWDEPADSGGYPVTYAVSRATSFSGPWTTVFAGTSLTNVTVTGLAPNTNYWFRVVPRNAIGQGPSVSDSQMTTAAATPGAPRDLVVTPNNIQATLSWKAPANNGGASITGYTVSYSTNSGGPWTEVSTTTATTRVVTGLRASTTYFFRVTASNSAGEGSPVTVSRTTSAPVRPGAPTGLAIVAGDSELVFSWNAPANDGGTEVTSYKVYRAVSSRGPWTNIASGLTETTHTSTGLVNGKPYWFRVAAVNSVGEGSVAAYGPGIPLLLVPSAPENINTTAGNGQVALSWGVPSSIGGSAITGYTVYRATNVNGPWTMHATGITALEATVTGLTNGTPYWFQVTASNSAGEGAPVTSNSATPVTVPGAPQNVSGTSGESQVNVSWTAPANNGGASVNSYSVYYSTSSNGPWLLAADNVLTTSRTVTSLANGTPYWFRVTATNSVGEGAAAISSTSVTPYPTLTLSYASSQFTHGTNGQTLSPSVSGGSGAKTYAISAGTLPANVSFNTSTGVFTGPATADWVSSGSQPGFPATVTVSVTDVSGTVNQQVVLTYIDRPTAPQNLEVTYGDSQLNVTWTAPLSNGGAAITGYTVEYATNANGPWTVDATSLEDTNYIIAGLTNGTEYWVRVKATNSVGDSTYTTTADSLSPATTASEPENLTATPGNASVALDWDAPASVGGSAVTGYTVYYSTTSASGPWTQSAIGIVGTSRTVTGLTNGTAYWFRVTANNTAGEGAEAVTASTVTPATTPAAPESLVVTPGVEELAVSWAEPGDMGGAVVTGYTVYYSTTSSAGPWTMHAADIASTSTIISELTGGTGYWIRVTATNSEGEGAAVTSTSSTAPFNFLAFTYPMTEFVYGTNNSTLTPTTNGGSGTKTYAIVSGNLPEGVSFNTSTGVFTGPATGEWTDPQTQAGFPVNLTVSVSDDTGTDLESITLKVIDKASAPTSLVATPGNTEVSLTWEAPVSNGNSTITGYTVYRATSGTGPWTQVATGIVGTSRTVTGLTNGTAYWFRVAANNNAGESAFATASSITPRTTPGAVTGLAGTAGDGQVTLAWTAPASNGGSAITDYIVQRSTSATGPWTTFADGTSASTGATVTGLTNQTAYWFRVTPVNAAGEGTATVTAVSTTPFSTLGISYASTQLTFGSNSATLTPTVSGGAGTKTYAITSGELPAGVSFNTATGVFTGPATAGWNFKATSVVSGVAHTCSLTTTGGVKCWGDNLYGQLGNSGNVDSSTPVNVTGLGSGVASIAAGANHTCAVTTGGAVKCWGEGGSGRLGNGSTANSNVPVNVTGLGSGISQVSAGAQHTCALTTGGAVSCWGNNGDGRLGDGTSTNSSTPVNVSGLTSGVSNISTGSDHTCAVNGSGGAVCWGANSTGQIGDNSTTPRSTATAVSGLASGVSRVDAGVGRTCAVTTTGAAQCWGANTLGQLGDGSTTQRNTPVGVTGLTSGVSRINLGLTHTCALMSDGTAKCWGEENWGQLGNGADTGLIRTEPVTVTNPAGSITSLTAGEEFTCMTLTNGTVKCVGRNGQGQLGDGSTNNRDNAVSVSSTGPQAGFPVNLTVRVTDSTGTASVSFTLTSE